MDNDAIKSPVLLKFFDAPIEIASIGDNAFDLVGIAPLLCINAPKRFVVHRQALWGFEVDNAMNAEWDFVKRARSICFEQNFEPFVEEFLHQPTCACFLNHGLATCDFDEITVKFSNFLYNIINFNEVSFIIGVLRVAPCTTDIASRKAHENAGLPRKTRFSLKGVENFTNFERVAAWRLMMRGAFKFTYPRQYRILNHRYF